MQTAPENWNTYFANPIHTTEYQIIISEKDGSDPVTYGMDSIKSATIESALLAPDVWIGNAVARRLSMTVLSSVEVPRMAKIVVQCRLGVGESYTDYMPIGTFWVDERDRGSLWTCLVCYDAMLLCDQPFINIDLEEGEWPLSMADAVAEICTRTGLTLDSRTTISTGADYIVPYTNDLSMREVLGYIASCHGGNWTITPEGKLRLIILASPSESPVHILGQSIKSFREIGELITISKLTMYDDAENAFSAGNDTKYHLEIDCPYATTNIVNDLCNATDGILYGVEYTPFEATNVRLNPLSELGDDISVGNIVSVLNKIDIRLGASYVADISCPGDEEVDHEYPYLSTIQRTNNRAIKQGATYYGTSISRAEGLKIAKSDGSAEVLLNSDVFAMRAKENDVLKDKIYFDPAQGTYVFDGILSADVIQALSAVITPNLYAEKATIAELTVDQVDTSKKVLKYLAEDATDDNFQRIYEQYHELVTAETDGLEENRVQAQNRKGELLYWIDETHTAATTEETDYPVWTYHYDELVKYSLGFYQDTETGHYLPMQIWGAGTGATSMSGRARIAKLADSFEISYTSSDGQDTAGVYFRDDGFVDVTARRANITVDTGGKTITITPEGEGQSDIVIDYTESGNTLALTWPDGETFRVKVV
jgi:hypothetical protein